MKRFLLFLLIGLARYSHAQNVEGQIVASQFGEFRVQNEGNGFAFDPASCNISGGGKNFPAFATGTPVKIVDSNPAQIETVTPVNATITGSYCAVSLPANYPHTSFYLTSGTGGLQEAITNSRVLAGGPNTILLNAEWYQLVSPANPATAIASVTGGSGFGLVDVTTTPYSYYQWNGSQYVAISAGAGNASFPGSPGIVYNNNASSSTNATSSQIAAALNTSPSTQLVPALLPAASSGSMGVVKPDNSTITVTGGVISSAVALPAASAAGQVPISNGAGTTYAAGQAALSMPGTEQYIQQPLNNSFFTTLRINSLNNVLYVDGFKSYGGIGVAPVAWSSATNEPECQVVSYSGSNYIALNATNNTTTPGTSYGVWYPVPNNLAATISDCAWYMAESYKRQNHQSYMVEFGAGHYTTNQGFLDYVDGNSFDDEFSVSSAGCGSGCTYLTYTGNTAIPVFKRPTGAGNTSAMQIHDMVIDGGGTASAAIEVGYVGQTGSFFYNLQAGNVAPGSDHVIELGLTPGDSDQVFTWGINIGVFPDHGVQNCGNFTANVVAGAITSYTVNSGGDCYSTYSGNTELTVVMLRGYQGGTATQPCAVMPDPPTATITGSSVTAITPGINKGSGCTGTIDVQVYQTPNVNYGAILNGSDSTYKDIISYVGSVAAFAVVGGDNVFEHLHPAVVPNGILSTLGGGVFHGTEIDDIGGFAFQLFESSANTGTTISQTHTYIGGARLLPGSATYYLGTALATTKPITIGTSGTLCAANPGGGTPVDWQEFVTQSGTINSSADYVAKAPAGLSVLGNDTSCGQTMGDYSPGLTIGTSNQASVNVMALGAATSGTNYNSGLSKWNASYWNGSVAATDSWTLNNVLGTGSNPASTLTFAHSGSPGAAALALPSVTTAVTQSGGDNSTKVATTAYVANAAAANFAAPPAIGGTTPNAANFTTVSAAAFNLQSGAAGPYSTFFDDFYTGANMALVAIGSAAGDTCSPSNTYTDNNHPGNMLLTSGSAGTGTGVVCGLVSEANSVTSANTSLGWTWETAVYVPVLPGTTAAAYQAGLAHTPNANPWTTGIGFYLSSANGVANDWYCRYNSTSTDSGVTATVVWTRLTMVNDGTNVHWYIGGTQVCGTGVAIASMPSTTQYPAVWSATGLSTTSVTMAYDYIDWQRAVSR